ncbi:MAG: oligosaccharide flippase family protein [Bacteroidetes bacterium]|nr:oligosaccharide flippase family protein [Bacteroidota bacterium]
MYGYRKILWSLVNNSLEILIGMTTIILVTRLYSKEEVGAWTVFMTVFFFVTKLKEGVIQTALIKFSSGLADAGYWKTLKVSFITNLILEAIISIILVFIGWINVFPSLSILFLLYPVYSIPWSFYRWQLFVHQSGLKVELIFRTNLMMLVILGVGFSGIITYQLPIEYLVISLGAGSLSAAFIGFLFIGVKPLWSASIERHLFTELISFGKFGMLREMTGTLSSRINVFLTAGFLSLAETGLLGIAQRYTQLVSLPNTSIQTLMFPKACELVNQGRRSELKPLFESTVAMLLAMLLPAFLFLAASSWGIIWLLNGSQYVQAAPLMIVMVFTVAIFAPFGNAFGSVMNAAGLPQMNMKVVLVNSVINIILSFSLVLTIGLAAAVIAPLITEISGFFWIRKILKKEFNISFSNCFKLIPESYSGLYAVVMLKVGRVHS